MSTVLWIAVGGAIGSAARYGLAGASTSGCIVVTMMAGVGAAVVRVAIGRSLAS